MRRVRISRGRLAFRQASAFFPELQRAFVRKLTWLRACAALVLFSVLGCRENDREHEAAPPPAAATVRPCDSPPEMVEGLPGRVASFCVDEQVDVKRYGAGSSSPLEAVCVELFNAECDLYRSYGLEGLKTLRYVESSGAPHFVSVTLTRFRESKGAFGFFTQRVLGDAHPGQLSTKPVELSGRAALGVGTAILWRGQQVAELTYVSDDETPDEIARKADPVLLSLSRAIANALPGPTKAPLDARLLEMLGALPLGVTRHVDGALGVVGSGDFALAHHERVQRDRAHHGGLLDSAMRDAAAPAKPGTEQAGAAALARKRRGGTAHRMMVAARADEEGAEDVVRLLRRQLPSHSFKHQPIFQLRVAQEQRAPETWFASQLGRVVLFVGPPRDQPPEAKSEEERAAEAEAWRSFAVARLLVARKQAAAILREE